MSTTYLNREISEWNTSDLCKWLIDNKYPGISELCQNNSLSGYDLFYITDDILKNEFGLNSFHERKVTMKLIKKLIYEHLKINIINSNGDNVVITLDNNPDTSLGELSEYIGGMFNINPKDILYKDTSKTEVLSPSLKIVELLILYPRLYKTLNVFNIKDYQQTIDNENTNEINDNIETRNNNYNINNNSSILEERNTMNDSLYQKQNIINSNNNNNKLTKMNFDYKIDRNLLGKENLKNLNMNKMKEDMNNIQIKKEKYSMDEINEINKRMIYNEDRTLKNENKDIIFNDDYDMGMKDGLKYYNRRINDKNFRNKENIDDNYSKENSELINEIKYKTRDNYYENEEYLKQNDINKRYASFRPRKNMNFNSLGIKSYP
jgi:hypothetical protein